MRPWLSLPESFAYRIFWILREVMVGLVIRFTRETFIKDGLLVLPTLFVSARSR